MDITTPTKLTIFNTIALLFSFTDIDESLRTILLILSALYTGLKITELIIKLFRKDGSDNNTKNTNSSSED